MKSRIISLCIAVCAMHSAMAQITSLGRVTEGSLGSEFRYGMEYHGDCLYAAAHGLYRYDLNDSTSGWQKLAITDSVVVDFGVRGDTIVALTDRQLHISTDGGKTSSSISVDVIRPDWNNGYVKGMTGMALHPSDTKRIHIAFGVGLFYTEDGGDTWVAVDSLMSIDDLEYNPLDEKNLIGYGCPNGGQRVYVSTDGGFKWERTRGYDDINTTFTDAAFHPTDKNRIVICGYGIYAMSNDQGHSWEMIGEEPINPHSPTFTHLDNIVYDSRDADILYGTYWGAYSNGQIPIRRSKDGGFSWETIYVIEKEKAHGVHSMCMMGNMLVMHTWPDNEVYLLDVDAVDTSISPVVNGESTVIYYDLMGRKVAQPTRGIYIRDGRKVIVE